MRPIWRTCLIAAGCLAAVTMAAAQSAPRRATTVVALRSYAGFYHLQAVAVLGEVSRQGERVSVGDDEGRIRVLSRDPLNDGRLELRGQFLDIGRLAPDDPRLIPFNLLDQMRAVYPDRWPRPGEELYLLVTSTGPPPPATNVTAPPLRTVAIDPARFIGQRLTLVGQFRGHNLFGDVPEAPVADKWEYVLRSADAAVWITGLQPKGKAFAFDPNKRIDSGRWLKVTGTVRSAKGLVWLEGTAIDLAPTPADVSTEAPPPLPPPPPVAVIFSAPAEGETDVRLDARIRLQLSRDLDLASLKGRVRIRYSATDSADRGEAQPPDAAFVVSYTAATRVIEVRPTQGWERFRLITVDFLDGVKGTDGAPMAAFSLTFTTGGG